MPEILITVLITSLLMIFLVQLLSSQFHNAERLQQRIYLQRQLTSAILQLRKDLRRAGFNHHHGSSAVLQHEKQVITAPASDQIGYVYRVSSSGEKQFRQIVYLRSVSAGVSRLLLCEKYTPEPLTIAQAMNSDRQSPCYSVFDPEWVQVDEFYIAVRPYPDPDSSYQWVSVLLGISLIRMPSVHESVQFSVIERNPS